MKIAFWYIGKSTPSYIQEGEKDFEKRLTHYVNYESLCFPLIKNAAKIPIHELKRKEADMILNKLQGSDYLIVLDEHGKSYRSLDFAKYIEKLPMMHSGRIVFLIGGAFGLDQSLLRAAKHKIALGPATFSHQLIRVMFLEQLYRACTINKGQKYHNE